MTELNHLEALSTRGTTRAALARDLRRRITDPACARPGADWLQLETEYRQATTKLERQDVLQQAWAVCQTCSRVEPCALLAVVDEHTGVAAQVAYRSGVLAAPNRRHEGPALGDVRP